MCVYHNRKEENNKQRGRERNEVGGEERRERRGEGNGMCWCCADRSRERVP